VADAAVDSAVDAVASGVRVRRKGHPTRSSVRIRRRWDRVAVGPRKLRGTGARSRCTARGARGKEGLLAPRILFIYRA
jgi:hypothetical protein